jgi:hypothetical protein
MRLQGCGFECPAMKRNSAPFLSPICLADINRYKSATVPQASALHAADVQGSWNRGVRWRPEPFPRQYSFTTMFPRHTLQEDTKRYVMHSCSYLKALRAAHVSPSSSPFSQLPAPTRSLTIDPVLVHYCQ